MEVQLTDFENAAFVVFVVLITRVVLAFDLCLYIPLSKAIDTFSFLLIYYYYLLLFNLLINNIELICKYIYEKNTIYFAFFLIFRHSIYRSMKI